MCEATGPRETLKIEVRGPSARVQVAESEVDRIGTIVDRSHERVGSAGGSK